MRHCNFPLPESLFHDSVPFFLHWWPHPYLSVLKRLPAHHPMILHWCAVQSEAVWYPQTEILFSALRDAPTERLSLLDFFPLSHCPPLSPHSADVPQFCDCAQSLPYLLPQVPAARSSSPTMQNCNPHMCRQTPEALHSPNEEFCWNSDSKDSGYVWWLAEFPCGNWSGFSVHPNVQNQGTHPARPWW